MPGESVLDPMSGSLTTVLEALLLGRHGIGMDIDTIALNLPRIKVTHIDGGESIRGAKSTIDKATYASQHEKDAL